MEQGMIFDIAHSSFVDGPGIRTTVFFKGCNLKCAWCHNPESQSSRPEMLYYQNKCTGCGECRNVCPHHLESCELCGLCTRYCPTGARKVCGEFSDTDAVMKEILSDELFYGMSGGGVTFSGGECMLQIGFLKTLLQKCREAKIHTAVDTAGNVPWKSFEEILPYTDLFLYDMKCYSEDLHKKGTGVSNRLILENLQKLSEVFTGEIIIRIPIIPDFNLDFTELQKMADHLHNLRLNRIEPLPYHRLGENKYAAIGKEGTIYRVPSKEEMEKVNKIFEL